MTIECVAGHGGVIGGVWLYFRYFTVLTFSTGELVLFQASGVELFSLACCCVSVRIVVAKLHILELNVIRSHVYVVRDHVCVPTL